MMHTTMEVLERKRKELEQEIADFKKKKEEEYRAFERQYTQAAYGTIGDVKRKDGGTAPEKQDTSSSPTQAQFLHYERSSSYDSGDEAIEGSGATTKYGNPSGETPESGATQAHHEHSRGSQEGPMGSLSKAQLHERELEFQGLFTPSFLPLLDGKARHESARKDRQSSAGDDPPLISLGNDDQQAKPKLSSSASFPDTHLRSSLSPPPARPLSASVPRQPSHQRRSSSRSDLSIASLRSSLRDPKQPRSPKRVLFSIGDVVVSPSTSPQVQRAKAASRSPPSELVHVPTSVEHGGPGAVGNQSSARDMFPWSNKPSDIDLINGTAPVRSTATMPLTYPNGAGTTSPLIGGDDFERVDADDELFAFDEDMADEQLGNEREQKLETDFESNEDEDDGGALPTSSPHAGSLPIEIKWPSRLVPSG